VARPCSWGELARSSQESRREFGAGADDRVSSQASVRCARAETPARLAKRQAARCRASGGVIRGCRPTPQCGSSDIARRHQRHEGVIALADRLNGYKNAYAADGPVWTHCRRGWPVWTRSAAAEGGMPVPHRHARQDRRPCAVPGCRTWITGVQAHHLRALRHDDDGGVPLRFAHHRAPPRRSDAPPGYCSPGAVHTAASRCRSRPRAAGSCRR
jgi:hypothetical protein